MTRMRAAVTRGPGRMEVEAVPEPGAPGPGEVLVRPEAVGLCGSDFHYYLGDIGTIEDPSTLYPRIQGHEAAGTIAAVGDGCPPGLVEGARVALWPVHGCGSCYPCSIGRPNACVRLSLIGVHQDGALQELLTVPAGQVFPVGDLDAPLAALIEPVSIAVRAVVRGRIESGERVVVLGGGPIGQALALAVADRGADVLLVDTVASRLEHGEALGADVLAPPADGSLGDAVAEWAGGDGPEAVFEATGVPELTQTSVELVAPAGRVVVVSLSNDPAPLRIGDLPLKEVDVLGTSCCRADEFAAAVDLVRRRRDVAARLVTHDFPLDEAPRAIDYAMSHRDEVMKAVVTV